MYYIYVYVCMYVLAMLKETEIYVNHPKREDPLPEKKQNKKNKRILR